MADAPLIYYVEDDENIRNLTGYALHQAGFKVRAFPDGAGFIEACRTEVPAAVLLDIMLPGEDGLDLLRQLRDDPRTENIPAMMLTAKGTEFDKVCGLDAGADDYLAKPFGMMELVSRVNALLRRAARLQAPSAGAEGAPSPQAASAAPAHPVAEDARGTSAAASPTASPLPDDALAVCGIVLSPAARRVTADGQPVALTLKEFDLLRALMENQGRVLSRDQLLARVWDMQFAGGTRTVDMHVKTLRKKLGAASARAAAAIDTVRGVGYRFNGDAR